MRAIIPLHRGSSIVTADLTNALDDSFFLLASLSGFSDEVARFDVLYLRKVCLERVVEHTDFFALIDVRRPTQEVQQNGKGFARFFTIGHLIAPNGEDTRQIVIVPKKRVPALSGVEFNLPLAKDSFETRHI